MATYTPNLNLGKPEATDAFSGFRQLFNDNMDILDNGGGGGSGGHTIIDQSGNAMPQETGLQFIGASVTDDSVNNKTVVTITGGGGGIHYSTTEQVIGTWIDGKPLYQKTWDFSGSPISLVYNTWVDSGIDPSTNIATLVNSVLRYGDLTCLAVEVGKGAGGFAVGLNKLENLNTRGVTHITLQYTKTTD